MASQPGASLFSKFSQPDPCSWFQLIVSVMHLCGPGEDCSKSVHRLPGFNSQAGLETPDWAQAVAASELLAWMAPAGRTYVRPLA